VARLLPDDFADYLIHREAERANATTTFLNSLTDRERALISDIAVMGYVRGSMHPAGEPQPQRTPVLAEIVTSCFAFPDLYPAVAAVAEHTTSSTVEYFVEVQQPDMTWVQASRTSTNQAFIGRQLAVKRAKRPDEESRIGWRITSSIVGVLAEPEAAP